MARRLFVTGNPTAGKSTLAKMLAEKIGARVGDGDAARFNLRNDPRYSNSVNFYVNQDEAKYFAETTPAGRRADFVRQSKTLWPALCEWVERETAEANGGPVVFESVNLLPDLVEKTFPGEPLCCLVSKSRADIVERLARAPRWGRTPELQQIEADIFFNEKAPAYRALAEAVGAPVFTSADEALPWALEKLG